jgi:ankyrin repeat protein
VNGFSALHIGVINGSLVKFTQEILQLLIKYNSDIHSVTNLGKNCIHLASEKDFPHIIAYLYNLGACINKENNNKQTPLHSAIELNAYNSASLLIALKAEKSIKDFQGRTALHLAAYNNNGRMTRLLLLKGFNKTITDNSGRIPEQLATEKEIKRLFRSRGIFEIFGCRPMIAEGTKNNFLAFSILLLSFSTTVLWSLLLIEYCNLYKDSYLLSTLIAVITLDTAILMYLVFCNPGYIAFDKSKDLTVLFT